MNQTTVKGFHEKGSSLAKFEVKPPINPTLNKVYFNIDDADEFVCSDNDGDGCNEGKPVPIKVILISLFSLSSVTVPKIIFASGSTTEEIV